MNATSFKLWLYTTHKLGKGAIAIYSGDLEMAALFSEMLWLFKKVLPKIKSEKISYSA